MEKAIQPTFPEVCSEFKYLLQTAAKKGQPNHDEQSETKEEKYSFEYITALKQFPSKRHPKL